MPVVRVSLLRGKSPEYLKAVSTAIYDAMVASYDLVPNDLFQIIHQHEPGELIYDLTYGGGPRSESFMLISIIGGKERSIAKKQAFFKHLVAKLEADAKVRPEDVFIMLDNATPSDFSFGSGLSIVPLES